MKRNGLMAKSLGEKMLAVMMAAAISMGMVESVAFAEEETTPVADQQDETLTEASTETETQTEAPAETEPVTEAPATEPVAETQATEPVTEAPVTEPVTEAPAPETEATEVSAPAETEPVTETEAETEPVTEAETKAETETEKATEAETETEAVTEAPLTDIDFETTELVVHVTASAQAALPQNTQVQIVKLAEGSTEYETAKKLSHDKIGASDAAVYTMFDVELVADGKKVEVAEGTVSIEIELKDLITADDSVKQTVLLIDDEDMSVKDITDSI